MPSMAALRRNLPTGAAGRSAIDLPSAVSNRSSEPTSVIVTIDAEIAPHTSNWKRDRGRFALDRDIYGITERGERGLRYQLDLIEQHGLKSVVFIESLSAGVLGLDLLKEIVGLVRDRGHEIALHLHTEWLPYYSRPLLGDRFGRYMSDFSEDDQRQLIDQGLENLSRAGAGRVAALRAGNAGASLATLRAARRSGLTIDSSYLAPKLNEACRLPSEPELCTPVRLEGIIEVPISWFRDGLGRIRPTQLCACSIGELEDLLRQAWDRRWHVVTLLLHSFELVRRRPSERALTIMRLHDRRLVQLCRLLAANTDKFVSRTFAELDLDSVPVEMAPRGLRTSLGRTIGRYVEQAAGRIM